MISRSTHQSECVSAFCVILFGETDRCRFDYGALPVGTYGQVDAKFMEMGGRGAGVGIRPLGISRAVGDAVKGIAPNFHFFARQIEVTLDV